MTDSFPGFKLRAALFFYNILMWLLLPMILLYLRRRGHKDPLYAQHLSERFGRYRKSLRHPVWIHAVSLGEMRSATPLIRALLAQGETVLTTHFTPAGRREAERVCCRDCCWRRANDLGSFGIRLCLSPFPRSLRPKVRACDGDRDLAAYDHGMS